MIALTVGLAVVVIATFTVVAMRAGGGSCGGSGLKLNVVSSPEKYGLMQKFARDYSGREVGGQCVEVVLQNKSSGEAMSALARGWNDQADGGPRPDVWSPAGSGWVNLLRYRLERSGDPDMVPDETPGIAVAPLVIAMPRPMAQALGWPRKQLGWDDVLKIAKDPKGWGDYGHPEWGKFRLGKTNPNFSTSGLNATVGAYFAATHKSDDLASSDLDSTEVQSYVRGVEGSVVHYGDTTLTFLQGLQRADDAGEGMSYVSAVAVEEMSVWYYNQGNPTGDPALAGKHAKPKTPLVAIYPKEGTLVSDHPFVTLRTAGAAKRRAAADFLKYLRGSDVQQRFQQNAFRTYDNQPGDLTKQSNGLLPDQPAKMLAPPAPRVLNKVLTSWEQLRKRANVLLVVDVSGSMKTNVPKAGKTRLQLVQASLTQALGEFIDLDSVGLWEFSTRLDGIKAYHELMPMGPLGASVSGGTRREALQSKINNLRTRGYTGLYSSTLAAYDQVKANEQDGAINSVVLLTDGGNDNDPNGISQSELMSKLDRESGVRIFTIAFGAEADKEVLKKISEATDAAWYNSSDPTALTQVLPAVTSNF
ncbi:MAG TPA: substrate-binding and VWA domain-containing protein [Streptosporangiaceae bacterium]|jgi:Ca-activated chloride channel family protein